VLLRLVIQPRASRSEVKGAHGDRLKIRVAAPPVDGEANAELIHFLKKTLGIAANRISILRGTSSREKDVFCSGISESEVHDKLGGPQS
jgi:uncharacterized protein (TIGR00251 family)